MPLPDLISHPLTHIREQRGWTQAQVAELIADGRNMASWKQKINRWERRGVTPETAAQYALATAVGLPRSIVDAQPWPKWLLYAEETTATVFEPWTTNHAKTTLVGSLGALTDRRGFLVLSSAALGSLAAGWTQPWELVPPEKLARALDGGRADRELVTAVERRLSDLWILDDVVGGESTAHLAANDLDLVADLLNGSSYSLDIERRLFKVAAGLCRMAGWGAFDGGRPAAAEQFWHAGLRAAREAGDIDGGVYILSNMAIQRFYSGDGNASIQLLDASRESRGYLSETVLAMLDTWQVRAHAKLGERSQAARSLASAEAHWDKRNPEDDPSWIYWMQRPSTTIEPNLAMIELGQPVEVVKNLSYWIDLDGDRYPRDHALALSVVAQAQIKLGQFEEAVATSRKAMAILKSINSGRTGDELKEVLDQLPEGKAAQEFQEEISEIG